MPDTTLEWITLLVGGAGIWGIGAAINAYVVRARVYYAHRVQRTIRTQHNRVGIEATLQSQGIPTAFCEVEWWNQGRRIGESLALEVTLPGRIISWELTSGPEAISGPWYCIHDPLGSGREPKSIRIQQQRLAPDTLCRLVMGFERPAVHDEPMVQVLFGDRAAVSATAVWQKGPGFLFTALFMVAVLGIPTVAYLILGQSVPGGLEQASIGIRLIVVGGMMVMMLVMLLLSRKAAVFFQPHGPSWGSLEDLLRDD